MKVLIPLLAAVVLTTCCIAGNDTKGVSTTLPNGWKEVQADPAIYKHPTLIYIPSDGRNAVVVISLAGNQEQNALGKHFLNKIHKVRCSDFLPPAAVAPCKPEEIKFTHGWGIFSMFEDKALVGKPPQTGSYKWVTVVDMVLKKTFVANATVFTDSADDAIHTEAMAILNGLTPGD